MSRPRFFIRKCLGEWLVGSAIDTIAPRISLHFLLLFLYHLPHSWISAGSPGLPEKPHMFSTLLVSHLQCNNLYSQNTDQKPTLNLSKYIISNRTHFGAGCRSLPVKYEYFNYPWKALAVLPPLRTALGLVWCLLCPRVLTDFTVISRVC